MGKIKQYKYITIVILVVIFHIILSASSGKNDPNSLVALTDKDSPIDESFRDYEKEFECDSAVATVALNACMLEKFSRAAAIREWKQRKLENLRYPEIDTTRVFDPIGDSRRIKKWRESFDIARDIRCDATVVFFYGSASSASYSGCGIREEIRALRILDNHYASLLRVSSEATGIPNFEPTESDIQNIIKTIEYPESYKRF